MPVTIRGSGQIIVQIAQAFKNDTFSTSSTSFVDITGLSVTITPTSASNRIYVMVTAVGAPTGNTFRGVVRLMRDSTPIGNGVPASARNGAIGSVNAGNYQAQAMSVNYIDSPATTSAITYKLQALSQSGSSLVINQTGADSDDPTYGRFSSMITVMEISGT